MKRNICLFLAGLVLLLCLCGCQDSGGQAVDTNSSLIKSSDEEATVAESLADKLVKEIDGAYSEESELPEYGTTNGMVDLADKYTEKWKQVADEYYDKIMAYDGIVTPSEDYYSADDFHSFVSNMKTNWEKYNKEQCESYSKVLKSIYGGGTIARPAFAAYKYEMQKEWALQIVGIYEQLHAE